MARVRESGTFPFPWIVDYLEAPNVSKISKWFEDKMAALLKTHPNQDAAQALLSEGRTILAEAEGAAQDLPALVADIASLVAVIGKDAVDVAGKNFVAAPSDVIATLSAVKQALATGARTLADAKAAGAAST